MDKLEKFFRACRTGKTDQIRNLIAQGIDPNSRDEYQLTALIWAGRKGKVESAKVLLEHGADIELGDVRKRTALFHAAVFDRKDFVEYLNSVGANVNPVDTHGYTPLDAVKYEQYDQMEALLRNLGGVTKARSA